jgi:hypothetical protein
MTAKDLQKFKDAAKAYTAKAVKSPKTARRTLAKEGIYTKSGKLSKRYK